MHWYTGALKRYSEFGGRAHRTEFWMFTLISFLLFMAAAIIDAMTTGWLLVVVYSLATLVPTLAIGARRLHDTGRSGWWQLVYIVPFGFLVLLVFWVMDSQPGTNAHGPNPKGAVPQPAT